MPNATERLGRRRLLSVIAACALGTTLGRLGHGEEPASKEPETKSAKPTDEQRRRERWKRIIKEYTIEASTEPRKVLELKAEPSLHWSNPLRSGDDGLVFFWLNDAKPQAVVCFYRVFENGRWLESHEFKSLSSDFMTATRAKRTVWSARNAGLAWKPIPDAPRPPANPAERLRQLRALAREFRVSIDVDKKQDELRLLPQPVYRYEGKHDGAVFAFALTTDPEAWLLIEERRDGDKTAWHYAFARMTSHPMVATRRGKVAWEVTRYLEYTNASGDYFVTWGPAPVPEP
jgi:hypothetical protein